jgi:hypothetical protein
MVGKQAKTLSNDQGERLLLFASTTRNPIRNRVLVLLSLKALRAGGIANLTWPMVLDPGGYIGFVIELRNHAAKRPGPPPSSCASMRSRSRMDSQLMSSTNFRLASCMRLARQWSRQSANTSAIYLFV